MALERVRRGAAVLTLAFCLWPAHAWAANAAEKATAETLFDEGVKLMKGQRFEEACPKLEDSQRIDPGVGTLLYLGECYEKLGRTASAWATFREAQSAAEASGQTKRAATAKKRVAGLETELSYLTIQAAEATSALQGLRVMRNGVDAGASVLGASVPVDPGAVAIEVSAPGYQPFTVTVTVQARSRQSVLVPALTPLPKPAPEPVPVVAPVVAAKPEPAPPPAPPPPPPEEGGMSALAVTGLVVAGVGVVGLGVGAYFGLDAMNEDELADAACTETVCQSAADQAHADNAVKSAKTANIAFAVGGALFVGGGLMFILAPSGNEKESASVRVGPRVGPGFAGIRVEGRL